MEIGEAAVDSHYREFGNFEGFGSEAIGNWMEIGSFGLRVSKEELRLGVSKEELRLGVGIE